MPFMHELKKTQCILLIQKTCIFELESYFLFTVTKTIPIQFTFFSERILFQFCAIKSINFNTDKLSCATCLVQHSISLYLFGSHQKKVIVNKVISFLKQCLQLASNHGIFFLVYSIYTFSEKQPRSSTLNYCLFCMSHKRHGF